jgi:hypothetical protein
MGVLQGTIVGLCSFCTKEISEAAKDRGVYLGARKPPTIRGREIKIKGVSLFWWDGRWRVNENEKQTTK